MSRSSFQQAIEHFREAKGILRTSEALRLGIHPITLYRMRDEGIIEQLSRGVFRLSELPPLSHVDLVTVALAIPHGVICLISALSFHELTTQIPHRVDIACKRGIKKPNLIYPPIRVFRYGTEALESGVEEHTIDGVSVRVFSPEKTIVDCFKFRNRIGLDVAIEALKIYWNEKRRNVDQLMKWAKVCRMTKIIRPYIEGMVHE